jgi:hypothetical protein
MNKIIFCVGGHFMPICVDDPNIKHDSALMIEDVDQTYRISLGLNRDPILSRPYQPYYASTATKDKLICFRDKLTKLIETIKND